MTITHMGPRGTEPVLRAPEVVFIVESDFLVREALERLVVATGRQAVTAASAEDFLSRRRAVTPCCVLVDPQLPALSGFDLQDILHDRKDMPIIFMGLDGDVRATVRAMKGGAFEYLTKPLQEDVLLHAIEDAIGRSRAALSDLAQAHVLERRYASLSTRERDVMGRVVTGRLNKLVAADLGISEITVKAHRGKVMRKMQADSIVDLVIMAAGLRHGRVESGSVADLAWSSSLPGARRPQHADATAFCA